MRTILALAGLLLCALLAACGHPAASDRAADWVRRGDEALGAGDALASGSEPGTPEGAAAAWSRAVPAWRDAAGYYVRAFRLEEPLAARRGERGALALRIGRAWSKAARHGSDEEQRGVHADRAMFWLDQAVKLAPELREPLYERARLFDSDLPDLRDPTRAREEYRRYLQAAAGAGEEARGAPQARRARERLQALGG